MKIFDSNVTTAISAVALILLITVVFLTSCTPGKKESTATVNPIADAENISRALGCMFGGCKTPDQNTEHQEFGRAMKQLDRDSKNSPALPK